MRLALFLYGLTGGGATRRVFSLAKGFGERGHEVDLVVVDPHGPLLTAVKRAPLNLVPLRGGALSLPLKRRLKLFLATSSLAAYLRERRPEVFLSAANHAHLTAIKAWLKAGRPSALILRLSNHLSGSLSWERGPRKALQAFKRRAVKKFYREADFWVAVSRYVLEDALSLMAYPRARTRVIYNPIPVEEIRARAKEPPPHPWLREKRFPVVLGAGRLSPQKDFSTLIRAFARVVQEKDARLIILGKGREKKRLLSLAKKLGLAERVSFPGFFENPWSFMARADVFVLSSRYEGLPGVLLEALALGCPVVSTDCLGGCAEILEGGRYGPLVPVGDHVALSRAILSVLEAPPPSAILRRRAEEFGVEQAVSAYLEVFEDVRGWRLRQG